MTPMKKRQFIAAAAGIALLPARGDVRLPDKFEPQRDAVADMESALSVAKAQEKRVLVDVGGEWCMWCHILDRFIASDADVRKALETHYVWLKVNFSPQNRNEPLLSRWPKVTSYPHLFVVDASGQLVHSQVTSELEAGKVYDKAKVVAFLERYSKQP